MDFDMITLFSSIVVVMVIPSRLHVNMNIIFMP